MRFANALLIPLVSSLSGCVVQVPAEGPPPSRPAARAERGERAEIAGENPYGRMESRIFDLVNAERKKRGLKALAWNPRLDRAAKIHARNMATYRKMAHVIPESGLPTLSHRAQHVSYPYSMIAENIALGYADAESVVRGWMESPGHRRNILNPGVSELGTGVVSSRTGGLYFCQVFGRQLTSI
ncbi:MAG TPA: CAP domain-containing protein [Gemmatimonadaceae bacterium]|nr:CAP domain-containing protein [Gemmatimonadaceae bacterium]